MRFEGGEPPGSTWTSTSSSAKASAIYIDDRDEWDEHRVAYGYPLDIVEHLEALALDLERRVTAREAPFDDADDGCLARAPRRTHGRPTPPPRLDAVTDADEPHRADLHKDPARVSGMFDEVAQRLRPHQHRAEPRQRPPLARRDHARGRPPRGAAHPRPRRRHRRSSVALAGSGAQVVAADFSPGHDRRGRVAGIAASRISPSSQADATALPFGDGEFDTVTMSFGLRNVNEPKKALRELLRVTKPGGRLVVCEFSHPPSPAFNGLYRFYNDRVLPVVAKTVSSNADAYDYLNESIRDWPDQRTLSSWIRDGGVDGCRLPQPLVRHRRPAPRPQARRPWQPLWDA